MAECFPCPWCGVDVTATPPKKTAATVAGAVSTGSSPSILGQKRRKAYRGRMCPGDAVEDLIATRTRLYPAPYR